MSNCFADFLQNEGLYETIPINKTNISELCDLIDGKIRISEYCPGCKEMRVFSMDPITFFGHKKDEETQKYSLANMIDGCQKFQNNRIPRPGEVRQPKEWYWTFPEIQKETRLIVFPFVCAMDHTHRLDYVVVTDSNLMRKIGQFPSVADLSFPELKEYEKDVDNQSMRELRRAIGLHAQGIGVGSYVYLRRVFERILEKAKQQAQTDAILDLSNYDGMRVPEKIKLLKDYLPDMITSNPAIYSIVSKGIHQLTEEDCIKYFPVLQDSILIILNQWAQKRKEQETIKKLEASISSISSELSKN